MMKMAKELVVGDFVTSEGLEGLVVGKFATMNVSRDVLVALTVELRGEMRTLDLPMAKLVTVKAPS